MAEFGKLNFSTSFNPTSAFPLDARCYFNSLALAKAAAATAEEVGSSNTVYYYGMRLFVDDGVFAKWYTIQRDRTLKEDIDMPEFDLTDMGLSNVVINGEATAVADIDCSGLRTALNKGPVRLWISVNDLFMCMVASSVLVPDYEYHQVSFVGDFGGPISGTIIVSDMGMSASVIRLAKDSASTGSDSSGTSFTTDETLKLENGILRVNTTDETASDNTLPITSKGVYGQLGNINALLETI